MDDVLDRSDLEAIRTSVSGATLIQALYTFYGLPFRRRAALYLWLMLTLLVYGMAGTVFGSPERLISIELVLLAIAVLVGVPLHRSLSKDQISDDEAAAVLEPPEIDWFPVAEAPRALPFPHADAFIYVDAPLATPLHRLVGSLIDLALRCVCIPVYFLIAFFIGGHNVMLLVAAAVPLNLIGYGIQQALTDRATVGMRAVQLEWISFDGTPPSRWQRLLHMLANLLSALTIVGLVWAFVDEEGLTWPDHIAGMFPTLREYTERAERMRAAQSASPYVEAKLIKTDVALWSARAGRLGIRGAHRLKVG